jgi:hypothetical protein
MRNSVKMLVVPALVLAAACGRDEKPTMDEALRNDLSLASSMQPQQQFVSPVELGYGGYGYGQPAMAQPNGYYYPNAPQPVAQRRIYRAPATASRGTYSTGRASTGTQTVKNTKRDAIIGGVAGAAIGAVTSRDKLKGAVIGGVAGSVLGAVIGNNVDVKKIPIPY